VLATSASGMADRICSTALFGRGGGAVNIVAFDLYANSATSAFYDDRSLHQARYPRTERRGSQDCCDAGRARRHGHLVRGRSDAV
jgi:hypothetical protein